MAHGESDDTVAPWKARLNRRVDEQLRRSAAWKKSPAGREAAEREPARRRAEATRRRVETQGPGTYPTEIDGQPAYDVVCHCGTVNTVFANRMNFDQHQTCHGCRGLFMPEMPKASEGEQLFRELARDLSRPLRPR